MIHCDGMLFDSLVAEGMCIASSDTTIVLYYCGMTIVGDYLTVHLPKLAYVHVAN